MLGGLHMDKGKLFVPCVKASKFVQHQCAEDEDYAYGYEVLLSDVADCCLTELHEDYPREYNSHRGAKRRSKDRHQPFDSRLRDFRDLLVHVGRCPDISEEGKWTLDCIDPSKGYVLNNLHWASPLTQTQNRRVTKWHVLPDGQRLTTKQLADTLKQPYATIYKALSRGASVKHLLDRYDKQLGLHSWKFQPDKAFVLEPLYRKRRFKPQSRIEWYIRHLEYLIKSWVSYDPELTPEHKKEMERLLESAQVEYSLLFQRECKLKTDQIAALTGIPTLAPKADTFFNETDYEAIL